jgi:hypothetical protein
MTDFAGRYREHVARLLQAVLQSTGDTSPALREAIRSQAAAVGEQDAAPAREALPPAIDEYVNKVARRAFATTDADVQTLKTAGHSEDAILEMTLSAALGAGLARLEIGMRALKGLR